jgi:phosphopantothenoylcysteine decarboxylase / phosphopantothenate---cysteine ligase
MPKPATSPKRPSRPDPGPAVGSGGSAVHEEGSASDDAVAPQGRRDRPVVVLGVSAGIAGYKAVDVCRRLVDAGVHVAPVLTESATRFVGRVTFDALASEPAQVSLWDERSPMPHTSLAARADLVVVAPATADLLARYAGGFADDLLTATLLATTAPVVVCPAMHTEMWEHPAVRHNLSVLSGRGVTIVPPESGRLAGGDLGVGRLADPAVIVEQVLRRLDGETRSALSGTTVVVSAGGTREPIDPVRYLTNRSSGKQGHAVAEAAARRGAEVVLVTTTARPVPPGVTAERVETAAEMEAAVLARAAGAEVVVMAAAVADFRPKAPHTSKLSKSEGVPELLLEATPDILGELGRRRSPGQVLVGFAAETDQVAERARAKVSAKRVDLIVANDVSAPGVGFDHDTNEVTIFGADGAESRVPMATKEVVADAILDRVCALLAARRAAEGAEPT